jgi:hypothetical protein
MTETEAIFLAGSTHSTTEMPAGGDVMILTCKFSAML